MRGGEGRGREWRGLYVGAGVYNWVRACAHVFVYVSVINARIYRPTAPGPYEIGCHKQSIIIAYQTELTTTELTTSGLLLSDEHLNKGEVRCLLWKCAHISYHPLQLNILLKVWCVSF